MTDSTEAWAAWAEAMSVAVVPKVAPAPIQKLQGAAYAKLAVDLRAGTVVTPPPPPPPPPPVPSLFPTVEGTGWAHTGTVLKPYTGPSNIVAPSTILDGYDLGTVIKVSAPNVTIRNCRIKAAGSYGIHQLPGAYGLSVVDTEITSSTLSGSVDANGNPVGMIDRGVLVEDQSTLVRLLVHGTWRGIQFRGTTGTKVLVDSYVGDNVNPSGNHTSAVMTDGGTAHVTIDHNTLRTGPNTHASSAISVYPQAFAGGANDDWKITNNLLDTAGEYAVYLGGEFTATNPDGNTHMVFTGNRFGQLYFPTCGKSGPVDSWDRPTNTWADNAFTDGTVVPEPG